jgi:MSHA biogenesis protein MshQ
VILAIAAGTRCGHLQWRDESAERQLHLAGGVLPSPYGQLVLLAPGVAGSVDVSVAACLTCPAPWTRVFGVFKSGPVIYLRELY